VGSTGGRLVLIGLFAALVVAASVRAHAEYGGSGSMPPASGCSSLTPARVPAIGGR
jgi:hypothetical protein